MAGTQNPGEINVGFEPDPLELSEINADTKEISNGNHDIVTLDSVVTDSKEKPRAKWGNSLEFLMSCIAMSVGLGNIWRFPFTAYKNGGGAFLIPYIITLLLVGRPMYYMEMILGQLTSKGNVHMFGSLAPGLVGIGYGQTFATFGVASYYCSIMAPTLHYFFNSFRDTLPWGQCQPDWEGCANSSQASGVNNEDLISASEYYFINEVLHGKSEIDDGIGWPDWTLALYLLMAWACLFLVVVKGIKSSGKACYFLAIFPYCVMFALLIRAVTLEGSLDGIMYFISPKWEELLNPRVWYAAVTQCFFSLNVGFGTIVMYSSYNDFEHNINRDALVVSLMDTFTSLLAGFTIFGILGNLAHNLNVNVTDVIKDGGNSLAFVSYPDAIAKFDFLPQMFAVLFFFMLFTLGIGSLVALKSGVNTLIKDEFPSLKHWQVTGGVALVGFIVGLVYVTPGGQFILVLVDHFCGTFSIFVMSVAEVMAVLWFYGLDELCLDIEFMLKTKVGIYWRICWGAITPFLLLGILIYSLVIFEPLSYGRASYPDSATASGWCVFAFSLIQLPIWMCWNLYKNKSKGFKEMINATFSNEKWGPSDPTRFKEWSEFKKQRREERMSKGESTIRYKINTILGK